jgi:hypothetical protein
MKRRPYESPLKQHCYGKLKTFFKWNKCEICGQEFRREQGWWFRTLNDMCHPNYWWPAEYVCGDCIKTEAELIKYLKSEEERLTLPPEKD